MSDLATLPNVPRETIDRLAQYAELLKAENRVQNLIARSTEADLWSRHIADAAQLSEYGSEQGAWIDIGSGAGLPGIVLAIMGVRLITLAEPRRLRAEFLSRTVAALELDNAIVARAKAEQCSGRYDVITARAVASLDRLLAMTAHLSHAGTIWILPKGQSAKSELDEARKSWQGAFRLEPSRTDPNANIVIASGVRRAGR